MNRPAKPVRATVAASDGVSSRVYFGEALKLVGSSHLQDMDEAVLVGIVSAAGMGSETVAQNARRALMEVMDGLPADSPDPEIMSASRLLRLLTELLANHLVTDRIVIPLLEVLGFLLSMQAFQRLEGIQQGSPWVACDVFSAVCSPKVSFRRLFALVRKAHFKSKNMQKLHLAIHVYYGLGAVPATRHDTLAQLERMLAHPFPHVCPPPRRPLPC